MLRRSSVFLMLISATVWATVPLFFALGADSGAGAFFYTGAFSGIGGGLSLALFLAHGVARKSFGALRALGRSARTRIGLTAIVLDGGGIAISNAAFIFALSYQSDATVTLIVESWPLIAAFLLVGFVTRFRGLTPRQLLWSLVALVGFYFLVAAHGDPLFTEFPIPAIAAAVISALTQAIAVAAHQRALQDLPAQYGIARNFLLQFLRMIIASAVALISALCLREGFVWNERVILPAMSVAIATVASALLYALSLQAAKSAVVTLMWFLTPVISIVLLATVGLADITTNLIVGATLVICANIFLAGAD